MFFIYVIIVTPYNPEFHTHLMSREEYYAHFPAKEKPQDISLVSMKKNIKAYFETLPEVLAHQNYLLHDWLNRTFKIHVDAILSRVTDPYSHTSEYIHRVSLSELKDQGFRIVAAFHPDEQRYKFVTEDEEEEAEY